jgi:RimJ/RimL family protein N-acetyltransferase
LVILEPLTLAHIEPLTYLGLSHPTVFRYLPYRLESKRDFREKLELGLKLQASGEAVVFATRSARTSELAGSTCIKAITTDPACVEIGGTWLAPPFQRTGINRAAKLLQLEYCFERLGVERVEFKTDIHNLQSQTALTRLGLYYEGVRRAHMRRADGSLRDSVYFSVVRSEWPLLRATELTRRQEYLRNEPLDPPFNAA